MPPLGQGVGLALEDAVILDRLVVDYLEKEATVTNGSLTSDLASLPWNDVFKRLVKIRISHVQKEYDRTTESFDMLKNQSWLMYMVKEWLTWVFLKFIGVKFDEAFKYDVLKVGLE